MEVLRILKQLVTLADQGHFRQAADRLGITHSALSQTVRKLEDTYGVPVFARTRKGVYPTVYGQMLVDAARSALERFSHAEREIDLLRNLEGGRLSIGCEPTVSEFLAGPCLLHLMKVYPKLRFNLKNVSWREMAEALRSKSVDLFIGPAPDIVPPGIDIDYLSCPPPVIAVRTGHPLFELEKVTLADVIQYPLMGGDAPDWFIRRLHPFIDDILPDLEDMRNMFLTTEDFSVLSSLIAGSDAVALAPFTVFHKDVKSGRVAVLPVDDYEHTEPVDLVIASLEGRVLPPAASAFAEEVHSIIDRLTTKLNS